MSAVPESVADPGQPYLFVDLYSKDLGPNPPWDVLAATPNYCGAILKAYEGTQFNDGGWFAANWPAGYDGRQRISFSAGNFHGEPVGMAADVLAIAVAELANISERRTQMLLDGHQNRNLPTNLIPHRGINSGLMIIQRPPTSVIEWLSRSSSWRSSVRLTKMGLTGFEMSSSSWPGPVLTSSGLPGPLSVPSGL